MCLLEGVLMATVRGCGRQELQPACKPGVEQVGGRPVMVCYKTCHKDGCNGYTSLHHVLELLRRRRRY